MKTPLSSLRVDKWLWAARFFKTRQLAIKALNNRQISRQKIALKPASEVKPGDCLLIKRGSFELELEIVALSAQRGPASVAQTLYQETQQSISKREAYKKTLALQPRIKTDPGRPDSRRRRDSRAFKRGE